jgi:hypothetical protein
MELPITEKELEFILEKIKHNTQLYNKLWTYWFKLKTTKNIH